MTPEDKRAAADQITRYIRKESTPEDMADLMIPPAAIDLRTIPPEQWPEHVQRPVVLPEDIVPFIEGQKDFTREELDRLEDRIAAFYAVTEPYYITCEPGPPFEAWLGEDSN